MEITAVRANPTFTIRMTADEVRRLWDNSDGMQNLRNAIKRVYEKEMGPDVDL